MRDRTRSLVDAMVATGVTSGGGGRADLVASVAFPLPAATVFALLGFPAEDTELLKSWCGDRLLFTWGRPSPEVQAQVARTMVAYWGYCERFVTRRLAELQDDYTSDLLRVHLADPGALSIHEVTNVVYGLSFAGHETTTNLITNTVHQLLIHDDHRHAVCADPSLIPNAVEETLRYDTSVIAWRRVTTEPVELGGVTLPQGAKLLLVLGATGRDPGRFADPDRYDVARPDARTHLAFGKGAHFCLVPPSPVARWRSWWRSSPPACRRYAWPKTSASSSCRTSPSEARYASRSSGTPTSTGLPRRRRAALRQEGQPLVTASPWPELHRRSPGRRATSGVRRAQVDPSVRLTSVVLPVPGGLCNSGPAKY